MTISFKVSENTKEKAIEYFKDKRRDKTPAYAIFQADEEDTVVTLYERKQKKRQLILLIKSYTMQQQLDLMRLAQEIFLDLLLLLVVM